ncbi:MULTISPECIES: acyl-CoA dehydrogenase C-terminal domain-containing protein [unclassified Spongiibacter]|jgi:alkylation response protein AidB-like acyl-CoA dehydrogenase|uniref:acyl-CoA dehydrogenase C-terminal domain-containing protein n=2 Tax=Spongiibacteraceae TaxID=1706375 RepID=UPI000C0B7841|nr:MULTISPECIES: acyl-CoA dehydrogenase C-terminal domain-containing protein [unclassified Spongiibacter]MAK43821.1 acyl-CoA dehydrogenase [Spongiibacter sp.]|tara:strand:- start:3426 stop:5213 length:1788 start_codon:yes stop_codon:yes gene_type:complete
MPQYKAPLRDINFVLKNVLNANEHFASLAGREEVSEDLLDAILSEGAKFSENVLSPLNQVGDQEGCVWSEDGVKTPTGFKEAYQQFAEGGWPSMTADARFGGQGLPNSLGLVVTEMVSSACWAWGMYTGLSQSAARLLENYASEELQNEYLPKMTDGTWGGTMCLTEPHCGSDLGILRTKAEANADGSYNVTGTKIFISGGEHDMMENIIHLVLARIEGAPAGTKGISLFLVPKFLPDADNNVGERNGVSCGSIEHKMGIKASATCVMNFDGAKGFLVGEENRGLQAMFHMMNSARLGTALQGLSAGEASFQGALEYARERLQMRSLSGPKNPEGPADPLIVHPDVRRMLLTQKALAEGSRAFIYWVAQLVDTFYFSGDEQARKDAEELSELLTPIAKAFVTETGLESANYGMQVYGGHGYISEWGMEQIVRDLRISTLYEGTTGIQALDLLGRKVMGTGGKQLMVFTKIIHKFCEEQASRPELEPFISKLAELNKEWGEVTMKLGEKAMQNPDEVGAASVDYLMYSGYISLAYMWARMAAAAVDGAADDEFLKAKLQTAKFYYDRLLPRTESHKLSMLNGADSLMEMPEEAFAF